MTNSILPDKLEEYLSLRIALGIPLGERELPLRDFVSYLAKALTDGRSYAQAAVDWTCLHASVHSIATQHFRLSLARCFLRHLKASLPEVTIPDMKVLARLRRPTPYIFSTAQLKRLMKKAGSERQPENAILPFTLQTIIGLMACSGLRAGEVLRLKVTDLSVDHAPPRLLIRLSKFKKSRWVPLHYTAYNRLVDYLEWRARMKGIELCDAFFVCNKGKPLTYSRLRQRFEELLQRNNMMPKSGPRPTLHSLRHTFAVRRLRLWCAWKMDTRKLLPILSVYLGHKSLESSYWYLTATPELLKAASDRFEWYATEGGMK
jgi:integrase/recombinase XerD